MYEQNRIINPQTAFVGDGTLTPALLASAFGTTACNGEERRIAAPPPPLFHFRFGVRPKFGVRINADEELTLQIGVMHPATTQNAVGVLEGWGCAPGPDAIVNELTQLTAHIVVRAVVQMN